MNEVGGSRLSVLDSPSVYTYCAEITAMKSSFKKQHLRK